MRVRGDVRVRGDFVEVMRVKGGLRVGILWRW